VAVLHGIPEERQSYQMLSSMEEGDWNKAKAISSAWVQHAKRTLTEAAASDGRDPDEGDLFATQRPLAKVVGKGRGAEEVYRSWELHRLKEVVRQGTEALSYEAARAVVQMKPPHTRNTLLNERFKLCDAAERVRTDRRKEQG